MSDGWVKIYRKYLESRYGRSMEISGFFHALIAMANFTRGYCADGTLIEPGQFMTSQLKLSDHFNCSRGKVKRLLDLLEAEGQIEVTSSRHNSIITIKNWEKYQGEDGPVVSLGASNRDTLMTSRRTPEHTSTCTQYKNAKKGKNGKNIALVKVPTPLCPLFDNHPRASEIQSWLMSGEIGPQEKILAKYDPEYLTEVIEDAFDWNRERGNKYKAGRFISNWIKKDRGAKLRGGLSDHEAKLMAFFNEVGGQGIDAEQIS